MLERTGPTEDTEVSATEDTKITKNSQ